MEILEQTGHGSTAVYAYSFPSDIVGERWPVKIGFSNDPINRIRQQQASMRETPTILFVHWCDHARWVEQTVHSALSDHKLPTFGNEWFNTNPEELRKLLDIPAYVKNSVVRSESQFGYQLRMHRVHKGMTQTELSERSGIRQETISKFERGRGNPTCDTFFRLMAALNMELFARPRTAMPYDGKHI
jgi:HTH-type transcriptional regulator/antitoxin HipB